MCAPDVTVCPRRRAWEDDVPHRSLNTPRVRDRVRVRARVIFGVRVRSAVPAGTGPIRRAKLRPCGVLNYDAVQKLRGSSHALRPEQRGRGTTLKADERPYAIQRAYAVERHAEPSIPPREHLQARDVLC